MCKVDEEIVDHLFLHCAMAQDLWDMVFSLFGIQWVMPKRVVELLACWQGRLGQHRNRVIWSAIPRCVMWYLWRERNARTFEGCESNILDMKLLLFKTLFDRMSAIGLFSFDSFIIFCLQVHD